MATLNLGRIKPVFRGAWTSGAFVIDDIVTHGNESFICIQAGSNIATSNASYWTKLAAKGADGSNGTDVGTTITTQGDILYRDGSGLQRLAAGTSGQFLKTQGSGANPVWANNSATIAQLVHTNYASSQTHTSSSWTTLTGVTVAITPASTSNKIYINAGIHGYFGSSNAGWKTKLQRVIGGSATDVWEESDQKATYGSSSGFSLRTPVVYLDSPNTTSAVTYQFQVWTDGNSTVSFNNHAPSYITAMEVTV